MDIKITDITSIRNGSIAGVSGQIYFTNDINQEGNWYYDPLDSISADNTGTILTNIYGNRFKRIFDNGVVNVQWFGAIGNGINDDYSAIQNALNFISKSDDSNPLLESEFGGGTVFIPKGVFLISQTLLVGQNCRILGTNNRYHFEYSVNPSAGGSVIKANFENTNNWVISSATWENNTTNLLAYNDALLKGGSDTDPLFYNKYIYRMGINIENLTIDGGVNFAYGGIRLANAGNSTIRNIGVFNCNSGFMLNTCWGGSIENCFTISKWFGALILDCNSAMVSNSYLTCLNESIESNELPNFIYNNEQFTYDYWGLNETVKNATTGIYTLNTSAIGLISNVTENSSIGIGCYNSTISASSHYLENNIFYGVVIGIGFPQFIANEIFAANQNYSFYFGKNSQVNINGFEQVKAIDNNYLNILFVNSNASNRSINFSNTLFINRIYNADITFSDECLEGKNLGSIYIDPGADGNDDNYGFNINDPLKTFDAALLRIQDQSTINPVKTIYIKGAPAVEEGNYATGAAIKNLEKITVENCDILITSYGTDTSNPRARIYFDGNLDNTLNIGQIEMGPNVNLYFSNVDLYTNNADRSGSAGPYNFSLFGLKNSNSKLTFEGNFENIQISKSNIFLADYYNLFQANLDPSNSPLKSLVNVNFLNTMVYNTYGALSPIQNGQQNLGVICTALNSVRGSNGWLDSQIILNNF